jgi:hypothetical protein
MKKIPLHGSFLAATALLALAATGCGTTIINETITRQQDGWVFELVRLTDGPNSQMVSDGINSQVRYLPPDGYRFLHVFIKIRNASKQKRVFSYDACDFDDGDDAVLPTLITRYMGLASQLDRNESFSPNEESRRLLVYPYPIDRMPTRLKCADVVFKIPSAQDAKPAGGAKKDKAPSTPPKLEAARHQESTPL